MRPFEGIRIIDTTHVIAGPFATYQLALLGADVIKVEPADEPDQSRMVGGDPDLNANKVGVQFATQASNKRSIALDLKSERGRSILMRLVEKADIFIENYRPGAFDELGLGYDKLSAVNPRLIYGSISAFGSHGPHAERTAYDNVIQATSGLMAMTGTPDVNPIKIGSPVVDYSTGMVGAFALASALYQRERTGRGQRIELSMLATAMTLMSGYVVNYYRAGQLAKPQGNDHTYWATSCCYPTRDGLLMLGAGNMRQQRRLWNALGQAERVAKDHAERAANRSTDHAALAEILLTKTASEWEVFLNANGVPAACVRTMMDALADPQIEASGLLHTHADYRGKPLPVPMTPFTYAHGGAKIDRPPPSIGEHTQELLVEYGYTPAEIQAFFDAGIVSRAP
jgi:crotonobetainyl-CoA:carnitine CoA-transferase CaiB-like acyl-CoA transferase